MSEREYVWQAAVRSGVLGGAVLSLLLTLLIVAADPSVLRSGAIVQAPMWAMLPCGLLCGMGGWAYGFARVRQRIRAAVVASAAGIATLALCVGTAVTPSERETHGAAGGAWLLLLGTYGAGLLFFAGLMVVRSRRR